MKNENIFLSPYDRIKHLLTDEERAASDKRDEYSQKLKPHDYSRAEQTCHACGEFDSVIGDMKLCTECWIDDCLIEQEGFTKEQVQQTKEIGRASCRERV